MVGQTTYWTTRMFRLISRRCTNVSTSTTLWMLATSSNRVIRLIVESVASLLHDRSETDSRSHQAQAYLLLSSTASLTPFSLPSLSALLEEIVGFFLIESHVVRTTNSFRSEQDVEDLWDGMCERVVRIVDEGLRGCEDPEVFLGTKFKVLTFVQTLEVSPFVLSEGAWLTR